MHKLITYSHNEQFFTISSLNDTNIVNSIKPLFLFLN